MLLSQSREESAMVVVSVLFFLYLALRLYLQRIGASVIEDNQDLHQHYQRFDE